MKGLVDHGLGRKILTKLNKSFLALQILPDLKKIVILIKVYTGTNRYPFFLYTQFNKNLLWNTAVWGAVLY